MSAASPSKDYAKVRENVDSNLAMLEEDEHAEVRAIVDKGFTQLMNWLDMRLQQQEDSLRSLLTAQEQRNSQASAKMEPQVTSPEQALVLLPPTWEAHCQQSDQQITQTQSMADGHAHIQPAILEAHATMMQAPTDPEQIWVSSLVDIFDQLDYRGTGSIDFSDLEAAFRETGFLNMQALEMFRSMDTSGNGTISRLEWIHMVSQSARGSDDEMKLLKDFLSRLVNVQSFHGSVYRAVRARRAKLILRHDSVWRLLWDVMLVLLLCYVAVSVPVSIGFGSSKSIDKADLVVDLLFCFDVALNFRTSYTDHRDDTIVVDWKKIGARYFKSWFFLDFFASVPFEDITAGVVPDLTPARLLKFGKIIKVLKLLRFTKVCSLFQGDSESMESFKVRLSSKYCTTVIRMLKLLSIAFLFAHWLTCFCYAVDSTAFDEYFDSLGQVPTALQRYLAGMYWAMTTISTVGYGDITPVSDEERAFSMVAMVVGGTLYGYIVGSVTSIVTTFDDYSFAYNEQMEAFQSWLDSNEQIPLLLRRRLRKHFVSLAIHKTKVGDQSVVDRLKGQLRGEVAFFLIDEHVRQHPMVVNLSNSALAELVYVLQETPAKSHEIIVHTGDPGIGMYFLVSGLARYDQGLKWQMPGAKDTRKRFQHITIGESFGEEIIFGLAETYTYTVITIVDCNFKWIDETHFREHFKNLPELLNQMYAAVVHHHNALQKETSGSNEDDDKYVNL